MQRSCRAGGSFQNMGGSPHPSTSGRDALCPRSDSHAEAQSHGPRRRGSRRAQQPCSALTLHVVPAHRLPHSLHSGRNARQQSRVLGLWCQSTAGGPGAAQGASPKVPSSPRRAAVMTRVRSSCCDDESEARVWPLLPRPPGTLRPQAPRPVHQDHLIPESQGHWLEKTLPLPGSHPPPLLKRCHFAESSAWPDQTPAVQRERESAEGSWRGNMGSTPSRPRPLLPPRAPREAQA